MLFGVLRSGWVKSGELRYGGVVYGSLDLWGSGEAVQAAGPVRRWLPGVGMTHPLDRFKSGPGDIV